MEPESGAPHIVPHWLDDVAPQDIREQFWRAFYYTYKQSAAALADAEINALQRDIRDW